MTSRWSQSTLATIHSCCVSVSHKTTQANSTTVKSCASLCFTHSSELHECDYYQVEMRRASSRCLREVTKLFHLFVYFGEQRPGIVNRRSFMRREAETLFLPKRSTAMRIRSSFGIRSLRFRHTGRPIGGFDHGKTNPTAFLLARIVYALSDNQK
jgi:hypothetical protein